MLSSRGTKRAAGESKCGGWCGGRISLRAACGRRLAQDACLVDLRSLSVFAEVTFAIAPKQTVATAAVANQEHSREEHNAANGARFPFKEESDEVQDNKHDVGLHQSWIRRLWDEQHGNQDLQAVHCVHLFNLATV